MNKYFLSAGTCLMMLLCVLTYSNHFTNAFHFDDAHTIQNNPAIRNIHNIPLFFKDGTTISVLPQNQAYRPLTVTSIAFDYWLGGGYNLFYFHLSTFILFLLQGVLMVYLFVHLLNKAYPESPFFCKGAALIATTWYMLHPAVAETVNYIIARADLQSTMLMILGFVLYVCSPFCRKTWLYLLPIIVGAFAKPPIVMFAPLLFIYILLFEENLSLSDIFKKQYFKNVINVLKKTLPSLICCAVMYWFLDKMTPKTWEPGGTSPLSYLITQPFVIFHYFLMFFVPNGLSADSDWSLLPSVWDYRFFIGCIFILVMMAIAFYTSKKQQLRPVSFGILWFFISLVPTSSIIPLGEVLNDHRMFLPFAGLVLSATWTIALILKAYWPVITTAVPQYKTVGLLLLLVILSGYAYGTYQRNKVWHTEESLWYDVTLKSPENGRGLMNYGLTQMAKGNMPDAGLYFNRALKLLPSYFALDINLAILYNTQGNKAAAEPLFLKAITDGNNYPDSHFYYARFLEQYGRYNEAIPQAQKAIEQSPQYLDAHLLLMKIYQETIEWDKLKQEAQNTLVFAPGNPDALSYLASGQKREGELETAAAAVKLNPTPERYLDLSLRYYKAGKYQQCVDAAAQAAALKSGYAEAYNNMGSAYNALGQYAQAVDALKKALAINPDFQLAKNNLAAAEAGLSKTTTTNNQRQATTGKMLTAEAWLTESLSDFNQGRYQDCIDACYKALALKPGYDLAYNNICAAYNKLQQWDKAIAAGKEGLTFNPTNQLMKNNLQVSLKGKQDAAKR